MESVTLDINELVDPERIREEMKKPLPVLLALLLSVAILNVNTDCAAEEPNNALYTIQVENTEIVFNQTMVLKYIYDENGGILYRLKIDLPKDFYELNSTTKDVIKKAYYYKFVFDEFQKAK